MIETLFPLGTNQYIIGGVLVGVGIAIPYLLTGLVAGVSTFYTSTWSYFLKGSFFQSEKFLRVRLERVMLAAGLITGGLIFLFLMSSGEAVVTGLEPWRLFVGGVLVGIGTRMSHGCTSGHGICGNASLEKSSLVATITFLVTGILVALLTSAIL